MASDSTSEDSEVSSAYSSKSQSNRSGDSANKSPSDSNDVVESSVSERGKVLKRKDRSWNEPGGEDLETRGASPGKALRIRASLAPSSLPSSAYLSILNETVEELAQGVDNSALNQSTFEDSQVGMTAWSAREKQIMFSKLGRVASLGISAIIDVLPQKSELEVCNYLRSLRRGAERLESRAQEQDGYSKRPVSYGDVQAAAEISGKCEELLQKVASRIGAQIAKSDAQLAQDKVGKFWLIDHEKARELENIAGPSQVQEENAQSSSDHIDSDLDKVRPAAELFKLREWLNLSTSLFMNSTSDSERQWRSIDDGISRSPAILATAVNDFYNLAVILTRRLISAAIFHTASRNRANDFRSRRSPNRAVKGSDVIAALKVLGVKGDMHDYWPAVARRCGTTVTHKIRHKSRGRPLTSNRSCVLGHEEVERLLKLDGESFGQEVKMLNKHDDGAFNDRDESHKSVSFRDGQIRSNLPNQEDEEEEDDSAASLDGRSNADILSLPGDADDDYLATEHDEYAESKDRFMSAKEEQYLWQYVLRLTPPPANSVTIPYNTNYRPSDSSKDQESNVKTWWKKVEYASEWEQHGCFLHHGDQVDDGQEDSHTPASDEMSLSSCQPSSASSDSTSINENRGSTEGGVELSQHSIGRAENRPRKSSRTFMETRAHAKDHHGSSRPRGGPSTRPRARHSTSTGSSQSYDSPSLLPISTLGELSSNDSSSRQNDADTVLHSTEGGEDTEHRQEAERHKQVASRRSSRSSRAAQPAYTFPRTDEDGVVLQQDWDSGSDAEAGNWTP